VGSNSSASSLGLANSYTIALLSYCAESNDSTICSKPKFGFHFDPLSDLQLDNTGMQGSLSSQFLSAISKYGSASQFLGVAYLLAFILTFLTPVFGLLASCFSPRWIIGGAIASCLATGFLLAASALSIAIFKTVKQAFDSDLSPAGIKTSFGDALYVLTWIATVLSLISTILLCISSRKSSRKIRGGMIVPSSSDKDGSKVGVVSNNAGPKPLTLLQRSLTWNKHKYAQLGKKKSPAIKVTGAKGGHDDDDVLLEQRGFGGGEDEEEEEELVRGSTRGIPLAGMGGGKPGRDTEVAYEPFRHL
jgi:hypothetical protein